MIGVWVWVCDFCSHVGTPASLDTGYNLNWRKCTVNGFADLVIGILPEVES